MTLGLATFHSTAKCDRHQENPSRLKGGCGEPKRNISSSSGYRFRQETGWCALCFLILEELLGDTKESSLYSHMWRTTIFRFPPFKRVPSRWVDPSSEKLKTRLLVAGAKEESERFTQTGSLIFEKWPLKNSLSSHKIQHLDSCHKEASQLRP